MSEKEKPYAFYTVSDQSRTVPSPSCGHWRSVAGVYDLVREDSPRISLGENSWKCTGESVATFKNKSLAQRVADLLNKQEPSE